MTELERKFTEFDSTNPHVYSMFKKLANQARAKGRERYSAKTLIEVIRWHSDIVTKGSTFKISNNHTAYYSRKLINEDPRFKTFFVTRLP